MASTKPLNSEYLRKLIHDALSQWRRAVADDNPLAELLIYQRAQAQQGSADSTTAHILEEVLGLLAAQSEEEATILRLRFYNELAAHVVAQRMNMSEGNVFKRQREAIEHAADILAVQEEALRAEYRAQLAQHLPAATYTALFGMEQTIAELVDVLTADQSPRLISLEGIGGIGKTSLAHALVGALIEDGVIGRHAFSGLAWVTARRQQINAGGALHKSDRPALPEEELIIALADQLLPVDERRDLPVSALGNKVRSVLKQSPHLVVIDNLETDADIHALSDILNGLADPSRFLLTSRRSLFDQIGFFPYRLPELSREDSIDLLRNEARQRNLPLLASAPDNQLHAVHSTVGGNPLALRLVVGLTHVHSLDHVLDDLTAARGQAIEQLYTHIYRRSWERLREDERNLLLVMPLINENGAEIDLIADIAEQPAPQLRPILERLVTLNLVESRGDLHRRCYTIHSLTRAFLHEQVLRWSPPFHHEQSNEH